MSATVIAIAGIVFLLVLLFLRVPVSFAMLATGLIGSILLSDTASAMHLMSSGIYGQFASTTMVIIPLFIFMGQIIHQTGMSAKLFKAAYHWIGFLPGGVAATTIATSIVFSAVSGSNSASTATMGSVALPEMRKYNYDRRLAGGTVAIGGIMGILTPPSTALIIIAVQSEQSIVTLFQAALFPGVLVGLMLLVTVLLLCWRKPELGPAGPRSTWAERFTSLGGVIQVALLFGLAVVGMLVGLFTPMEASAVGALGALVLGVLSRSLSWRGFIEATLGTLRISAMVILLVASAIVFGHFLTLSRVPFELANWVAGLPVAPVVILLIVVAIYLVGGALMDALGFLVISIPIFFPLVTALGYDLVWFTVLVTLVTTIGSVTPPVGVNVFITSGTSKSLDVVTVFRGVFPFFIPLTLALALFIVFPDAILFAVS